MDNDVETLFPMVLKQSNLPFMFVDNAKQYEDPAKLFRSVINVMLFMITHIKGIVHNFFIFGQISYFE